MDRRGSRGSLRRAHLHQRSPLAAQVLVHLHDCGNRTGSIAADPRTWPRPLRRPDLDQHWTVLTPTSGTLQNTAGHILCRLPCGKPGSPRHRWTKILGPPPTPNARFRTNPAGVARIAGNPDLPARPRLLPAVLRPVRGHAVPSHRTNQLDHHWWLALRRWRRSSTHPIRSRATTIRRLAPRARPRRLRVGNFRATRARTLWNGQRRTIRHRMGSRKPTICAILIL